MTRLELGSLRAGDIVQDERGDSWVVTGRVGEVAIAIRTAVVSHPEEWRLLATTTPVPRVSGPREA